MHNYPIFVMSTVLRLQHDKYLSQVFLLWHWLSIFSSPGGSISFALTISTFSSRSCLITAAHIVYNTVHLSLTISASNKDHKSIPSIEQICKNNFFYSTSFFQSAFLVHFSEYQFMHLHDLFVFYRACTQTHGPYSFS